MPVVTSYFMDQNQRDAVIGRVTREKREADHECALLKSEATKTAEKLRQLASLLEEDPLHIGFEGDKPSWPPAITIMAADFDYNLFKRLLTDLQAAIRRSEAKAKELESLLR